MKQAHRLPGKFAFNKGFKAWLLLAVLATRSLAQAPSQATPQPPLAPAGSNNGATPAAVTTQITPTPDGARPATALPSAAPAPAPPGPTGRPRIGLALGGGGAVAMSEIGVLEWFENHHIPVDMIAGTSMGCMVSALYSTGHNIDQLKVVMNDEVFSSIFSLGISYKALNFRRREDSRALPNAITAGLKHGVSFRNSVLVDQGLNAFLDRQFLPYNDQVQFNALPIPLRCISTDITDAAIVTFARGSIPDAVRASVSIPGVYPPYNINGHQFVDGAVLRNLPTQTIRDMKADVVLAVSLPLTPYDNGDVNSILGVLQRSFAVAIEDNEEHSRALASVVITPDIKGFGPGDFLKTRALAERGYQAAESHKAELLKYSISDQEWSAYLAERASRVPGPPGSVLHVHVKAPNQQIASSVQRTFISIVNRPVEPKKIEALLDQIRSDGRYEADYTVAYETTPDPGASSPQPANADRPVVQVTIVDKRNGPPFLEIGTNVEAQAGGVTRGTLEAILIHQDLGGYGSELRASIKAGFLTEFNAEYYRHLASFGRPIGGLFLAPQISIRREPFYIYRNQVQTDERQLQHLGGGLDIGWGDQRVQELRLGWQGGQERWQTKVGSDGQPDIVGSLQLGRIRYAFDNQDRSLVPQFGIRIVTEASFLFHSLDSPNTPQITSKMSYSHDIGKNIFIMAAEGGTMFNKNVAQPFRFTLGGPLRLTASAVGEYRGTDYFLVEPAFLRRIAKLPAPLGQSIYIGAAYEAGQMRAPDMRTITRQDVYFGLVAETPLGIITIAPAIGDSGHRKFVFTLGKLF